MDTSNQYIKMSDCPEIQEQWKPEIGDWVALRKNKKSVGIVVGILGPPRTIYVQLIGGWRNIYSTLECIWLPRQDQIQDMCKPKIREDQKNTHAYVKGDNPEGFINSCLLGDFFRWEDKYYKTYSSMEQLWLAFYIHER